MAESPASATAGYRSGAKSLRAGVLWAIAALGAADCRGSGAHRGAGARAPAVARYPQPALLPEAPPHPQHALRTAVFELWAFDDLEGTLLDFRQLRALLRGAGKPDDVALVDTQIARALALQGQVQPAQELLLSLRSTSTLVVAYSLLERARIHAQLGQHSAAERQFGQAFRYSAAQRLDALAVEAAWLAAGVSLAPGGPRAWLESALTYAESAPGAAARTWRTTLCLDWGWAELRANAPGKALPLFQRAVELSREAGKAGAHRNAQYALAHSYRRLARYADALSLLVPLQEWHRDQRASRAGGLVQEELAECLLALGDRPRARAHFRSAHGLLSQDAWIAAHQPQRLQRLLALSR